MFTKLISECLNKFSTSFKYRLNNAYDQIANSVVKKVVDIGIEAFQNSTKQFAELNLEGKKIVKEELREIGKISQILFKDLGSHLCNFFSTALEILKNLSAFIKQETERKNCNSTFYEHINSTNQPSVVNEVSL